jgi:hypothetical protein
MSLIKLWLDISNLLSTREDSSSFLMGSFSFIPSELLMNCYFARKNDFTFGVRLFITFCYKGKALVQKHRGFLFLARVDLAHASDGISFNDLTTRKPPDLETAKKPARHLLTGFTCKLSGK